MQKRRKGKGWILRTQLTQGLQKGGVMDMTCAVKDGIVMVQQQATVSNHGFIVPLSIQLVQGFGIIVA